MASDLNQLEKDLSSPDAVMEAGIFKLLSQYIKYGGKPTTVVEALSESYKGYAQMAHLLCDWLALISPEGAVEDTPSEFEVRFCQSLVKERFDSKEADKVFSEGQPLWLKDLVEDPAGRSLIYDLSEKHRNCNLLSYAIQYIWHKGHEDEIAGLSSASAHFDVFHRLISRRLLALQHNTVAELSEAVREISKMCSYEQSCYLHASLMLRVVAGEPGGERFRRMWQELEGAMAQEKGGVVWRLGNLFPSAEGGGVGGGGGGGGAGMEDQQLEAARRAAAEAYTAVGDMLASGRASAGDVLKLHKMYSQQQLPPINALRHVQCVHLLLSEAFDPSRPLPPDRQPAYLRLLGLAAAAADRREQGGGLSMSGVQEVEAALRTLRDLLEGAKLGRAPAAEDAEALLGLPMVATALVLWVRRKFASRDQFLSGEGSNSSPILVAMMAAVARAHVMHHAALLEVVGKGLRVSHNTASKAVPSLVDLAVLILTLGSVDRVMIFMEEFAACEQKDPAVLARFATQVLQVAAGPYSPPFARWLLGLLAECGVRRARGVGVGVEAVLKAFARDVAGLAFAPPLGQREAATLQELQA